MADTSHLERMGRELKCPICLSLFDSAVSLTCNHVFCNSCIHKSMRSGSNCPVCKVPFQRREVCPAPHMDNLVNIYWSMEVASGLNIFVTQNPSTSKLSDAEEQTGGDCDDGREGTSLTVEHQSMKGIRSTTLLGKGSKNSSRNRGKPSFPTNKRVQVPQSPITEAPVRQMKNELKKNKIINNDTNNSALSNEQAPSDEKGSLRLSPFFWLREDDDVDNSSQRSDVDLLTGTPAKAPSFSDIKDSDDDDVPSKMSPRELLLRKCSNADPFDSEMFEWTQRACSPELCPSPIKIQVGDTGEYDGMTHKVVEVPPKRAVKDREVFMEHQDNVRLQEKNGGDSQNGSEMPCKRGRKATKRSHMKRQKKNVDQYSKGNGCLKTPNNLIQDQGCESKFAVGSSIVDGTPRARYVGSTSSDLPNEVNNTGATELAASSGSKRGTNEVKNQRSSKRNFNNIKLNDKVSPVRSKKQKKTLSKSDAVEEVVVSRDEKHEDTMAESNISLKRSSDNICSNAKRSISCITHRKNKKYGKQMGCRIEKKATAVDVLQEKHGDGNEEVLLEIAPQAKVNSVQEVPHFGDLGGSLTLGKVRPRKDMPALRKCDANSANCAFCHLAEETEASGEMVHYSEGRPVSENHSGGSLIHSHRNCTEWAPNVYFENDIAVNLVEELARSRRIKCSLCGEKGAALGCYEKSCRKSFHVPCAKMLQECRWDTDHYVILCPLHASSKLPSELPISQVKKGKCNQQRKFHQRQVHVAVGHNNSSKLWNCGEPSEKVVLCCSALASAEKETISEFVKSSGAVVLKSWDPSVTHVIASVDENGACRRTLKILMGILEGKWILSIQWVQACMKAMKLVKEDLYEISRDIHGVTNGPRLGRLRLLNKQPKLFSGFNFYFTGDFAPSYKGYLRDLVTAAGGTVLHRKPIPESQSLSSSMPPTVIIYSIELPDKCDDLSKKDMILNQRRSEAQALANSSGSKMATNSWILNSIAGHKLQDL